MISTNEIRNTFPKKLTYDKLNCYFEVKNIKISASYKYDTKLVDDMYKISVDVKLNRDQGETNCFSIVSNDLSILHDLKISSLHGWYDEFTMSSAKVDFLELFEFASRTKLLCSSFSPINQDCATIEFIIDLKPVPGINTIYGSKFIKSCVRDGIFVPADLWHKIVYDGISSNGQKEEVLMGMHPAYGTYITIKDDGDHKYHRKDKMAQGLISIL